MAERLAGRFRAGALRRKRLRLNTLCGPRKDSMRREIAVQLVLTALALLLLLFVILFHQPTYVEEFPGGVSAPAAVDRKGGEEKGVEPSVAETVYRAPSPTPAETAYRPVARPRAARGATPTPR